MLIIGERLNTARKKVLEAFQKRDERFILDEGFRQKQAGAACLDLNAAGLMGQETEVLRWAIPRLQKDLGIPISVDTPSPGAMEAGLAVHQGKAFLNSLTAETGKMNQLLPLIREFRPRIIVLCLDDQGLLRTPELILKCADKLGNLLLTNGSLPEDIFIDPGARPLAVDPLAPSLFLESLAEIKRNLPGLKTIAGLSNVSFALPGRDLLEGTFLTLALERGLDALICDPLARDFLASYLSFQAIAGNDPHLEAYLKIHKRKPDEDT